VNRAGWVSLGFAVAAAFGYGLASVAQALAARRGGGTLRTVRHPLYLAGLAGDALAWLASLAALRTLAVYQVQAVLAGSLAVTVVAARLLLGVRLRRRDLAAVVATMAALGVLAACAGPQDPVPASAAVRWGLVGAAVLVAFAGWAAVRCAPVSYSAALAGLAFGGAALCARSVPAPAFSPRDLVAWLSAIASEPLVWALLGFGAAGMVLYAHALRHGQVGPVTAVLWIVEVLVPSVVGVGVLGDTIRAGWQVGAVLAGLTAVAAVVVLATAPGIRTTARS